MKQDLVKILKYINTTIPFCAFSIDELKFDFKTLVALHFTFLILAPKSEEKKIFAAWPPTVLRLFLNSAVSSFIYFM